MSGLVVTQVDRENGTITLEEDAFIAAKTYQIDSMYRRLMADVGKSLYHVRDLDNFDVGRSIALNPIEFGLDRTAEPVRLAGCNLGAAGPTSAAVIAVVGTVAALEWLRQRKSAVAAAEGSEEAYRSLLSDFIVWLTALFAKMRAASNA